MKFNDKALGETFKNGAEINEGPFKADMIGLSKNIETIAILTASNPKGLALDSQENNKRNKELETLLKNGKYVYRKVIGQYNSAEYSYVITNISLQEIKNLAAKYEQESFIFGSVDVNRKNDRDNRKCMMLFEYWQTDIKVNKILPNSYVKLDDVDRIVYTDKAIDFFTRRKNFKFNLPFSIFESMQQEYDSFNIDEDRLVEIKEGLHKNMSGKHLWKNRSMNYKKKKEYGK